MNPATTSNNSETSRPHNHVAQRPSTVGNARGQVIDTKLTICTPENVSFEFQLAGPFQRLVAYAIDFAFSQVSYWACVLVVALLLSYLRMQAGPIWGSEVGEALSGLLTAAILIGAFAITWFYGAYAESMWNGQTIGKRALSLRTLSIDGTAIDASQATLRNFFRLLDLMPFVFIPHVLGWEFDARIGLLTPPTVAVGLMAMVLTQRFTRVGDWVAGTMVVSEVQLREATVVAFDDPRVASLAALIPNDFVFSQSLRRCLGHYVSRRNYLGPARCREIAAHLVPQLLSRFRLGADTDYDLMLCAMYHRAFLGATSNQQALLRVAPEPTEVLVQ